MARNEHDLSHKESQQVSPALQAWKHGFVEASLTMPVLRWPTNVVTLRALQQTPPISWEHFRVENLPDADVIGLGRAMTTYHRRYHVRSTYQPQSTSQERAVSHTDYRHQLNISKAIDFASMVALIRGEAPRVITEEDKTVYPQELLTPANALLIDQFQRDSAQEDRRQMAQNMVNVAYNTLTSPMGKAIGQLYIMSQDPTDAAKHTSEFAEAIALTGIPITKDGLTETHVQSIGLIDAAFAQRLRTEEELVNDHDLFVKLCEAAQADIMTSTLTEAFPNQPQDWLVLGYK